jgi:hypothetical protein
MPSTYPQPCDDLVILKEKVAALEMWRANTEAAPAGAGEARLALLPCPVSGIRFVFSS